MNGIGLRAVSNVRIPAFLASHYCCRDLVQKILGTQTYTTPIVLEAQALWRERSIINLPNRKLAFFLENLGSTGL